MQKKMCDRCFEFSHRHTPAKSVCNICGKDICRACAAHVTLPGHHVVKVPFCKIHVPSGEYESRRVIRKEEEIAPSTWEDFISRLSETIRHEAEVFAREQRNESGYSQ